MAGPGMKSDDVRIKKGATYRVWITNENPPKLLIEVDHDPNKSNTGYQVKAESTEKLAQNPYNL